MLINTYLYKNEAGLFQRFQIRIHGKALYADKIREKRGGDA
jgi:hypothetical protein